MPDTSMPDLGVASANRLLDVLSRADRGILAGLEPVALALRQVLEPAQGRIADVYFVTSGLVSVVATTGPRDSIEVGMIGHEGMTGLAVVLGDDRSANETVVQSVGTALRLSSAALRRAMVASPTLSRLLCRYGHVFLAQASHTALANGRGRLRERLARWLLMWQDRLDMGEFDVTHEFLAVLLGVRRPGVTEALHDLEGRRLIRSTRSHVRILDRAGLEAMAGGFYGVPEAEYERAIGRRGLPRLAGVA